MEKKVKKILFITNIPAPYRIDFYEKLGKYFDLTVLFEAKRAPGIKFNWKENEINNFNAIFLKEGDIEEKKINWKVFKYLRKMDYDHIVVTNYAYFTELAALLSIKMRHIPYYYELDGAMICYEESCLKRLFKSFFLQGAKAYLSPSYVSDKYVKYYVGNKANIFRYPFSSLSESDILPQLLSLQEKNVIRQKLDIKEPKMILAVGQFIHRKGFDVLMEAVKDMDRNLGIYIVGGKPTEEYLSLQKKYDLTQVHFEGFKTKDELAEYFKAADLFVHPTREDIWGLVINEAMAYGLPVVTTNKCVAGMELVSDKDCLIDTDSAEQLKSIMETLMWDDDRRLRIAADNLKKIAGYTVEKMAEAHIKVFENL